MAYKAAAPCSLYRENIVLNPGSYSTTAGTTSDDWRFNAITDGTPTRTAHTGDGTAYATQPVFDSFQSQMEPSRFAYAAGNSGGQV